MHPFSTRWTTELAYAVGLLATDGCLSSDGRHIELTSQDRDQLQTFAGILSLTNRITTKISSYSKRLCTRIQFGNVQLYKFLLSIGLSPNKSLTLGELNIPNEYFPDFLRGVLDGDGCIKSYVDRYNFYKNRNYKNIRLYTCFYSASRHFLEWLQLKVQELIGLRGALIKQKSNSLNRAIIWELKFSKKESIKLLNWVYYKPNLPSLKRKRVHAQQILEAIRAEKRKVYQKIVGTFI